MMSSSVEAPALLGQFNTQNHSAPDTAPNDLILGEAAAGARLEAMGEWRPEELRVITHPNGHASAVIYGDCLADDPAIARTLDQVLATNDVKAFTQLPGSYTTLLFRPGRLTVLADLIGQYPFYYSKDAAGLRFSTITEPLRSTAEGAKLDTHTAAARLALPGNSSVVAGRSAMAGVSRLEAGHVLEIGLDGPAASTPYETFQHPTIRSFKEAAGALRAALLDSAGRRARSGRRLSADFSGGYDSTSASYLLAQASDEPLTVVTRHSLDAPNDDLDRVHQYLSLPASQGLFVPHEFVRPAADTAYANLLEVSPGDEPNRGTISRSAEEDYYQFLRDKGSELHISGGGADGLLDMSAKEYLAGLAHLPTLHRFIRGVIEAGRADLASPLGIWRDIRTNRYLGPATKLRIAARLLEGESAPEILQYGNHVFGPGSEPRWLTPKARRELADLAVARADTLDIPDGSDMGNYGVHLGLQDIAMSMHGVIQSVARQGMRKRAIFMDNDVIRACLGLPSHLRHDPRAFKILLAEALKGLVPPEVLSRSTKGDTTRHGLAGLRAAHEVLDTLLRDSRLADLGVIDPKAVRRSLDSIAMGKNPAWNALDDFIAMELWLRRNDRPSVSSGAAPVVLPTVAPEREAEPLSLEAVFSMPKGVSAVTRASGAVLINLKNAQYYRVNVPGCDVLLALSQSANLGEAMAWLRDHYGYPDGAIPKEIQVSAERMVRWLLSEGLLVEGAGTFSIMQGSETPGKALPAVMTRQENQSVKTRYRDYPAALGGFLLSVVLSRRPLEAQMNFISRFRNRQDLPPMDEAEANHLFAAVQRMYGSHVGRAACIEFTKASVLAAALKGRRLDMVLGFKTEPDDFHAWPEANGVPIRTVNDPEIVGVFKPILKI